MNFQIIKKLLAEAGQNMDSSGKMITEQAELAGKQIDNPQYVPSQEESKNEEDYFNNVTNSVVGSVGVPKGPVVKNALDESFNAAQKGIGSWFDVLKKSQALNRNVDFSERLAKDTKFRKLLPLLKK